MVGSTAVLSVFSVIAKRFASESWDDDCACISKLFHFLSIDLAVYILVVATPAIGAVVVGCPTDGMY